MRIRFDTDNLCFTSSLTKPTGDTIGLPLGSANMVEREMMDREQYLQVTPPNIAEGLNSCAYCSSTSSSQNSLPFGVSQSKLTTPQMLSITLYAVVLLSHVSSSIRLSSFGSTRHHNDHFLTAGKRPLLHHRRA